MIKLTDSSIDSHVFLIETNLLLEGNLQANKQFPVRINVSIREVIIVNFQPSDHSRVAIKYYDNSCLHECIVHGLDLFETVSQAETEIHRRCKKISGTIALDTSYPNPLFFYIKVVYHYENFDT